MKKYILSIIGIFISGAFFCQSKDIAAAQANNPLANMTALNLQNNYVSKLTDAPSDAYANTTWIRYAQPFGGGKFLVRASIPLSTIATPSNGIVNSKSGLGDINAFVSYNFVSKPSGTFGVGPLLSTPTASEEALGSGKWQGGLAFVAFIAKSPIIQFGGLATWQASIGGDKSRPNTNSASIQPFYFVQLGKGTYLRGAPTWFFDFKNDAYSMPMGAGIGKVIKKENITFNVFIEPQYTMLHSGVQPQFQIFTGINLQFAK